jgi:hypothetical protein
MTLTPGTVAAVRTKSLTVDLASVLKKSRLSMNKIAEPLSDKSVRSSRHVPSYPIESRNFPQPPGMVRFGLKISTGDSVPSSSAKCRRNPDFPTPASPRISTYRFDSSALRTASIRFSRRSRTPETLP